jgi:hypothetical protein
MTKARNIADLLDANGDVKSGSLDNVPAVDLTNLSASNLTSGTIPDARIPASAVSQHATSFDDNKIVNDISTLALRQASDQNKSAYNTNSQSVDVFQDDTGIDTTTNTSRNASEYISSVATESGTDVTLLDTGESDALVSNTSAGGNNFIANGMYVAPFTKITIKTAYFYSHNTSGTQSGRFYFTSNNGGNLGNFPSAIDSNNRKDWSYNSESGGTLLGGTFGNTQIFNNLNGSSNLKFWAVLGGFSSGFGGSYARGKATGDTTANNYFNPSGNNTATYLGVSINDKQTSGVDADYASSEVMAMKVLGDYEKIVTSATGNFTGTTITAPSSVSEMGAIITYQDQAGTNALNTDIVLQLSADGGSNYSTATLTALPDFSTGIKMAKVNDLAVTAGTQLKYKINFANQASGSKEARIRGVALQY